jgi:hypothetical protein
MHHMVVSVPVGVNRSLGGGAVRPVHQEPAPLLGYGAQYFVAIGPRRRLAPHAHMAMRGTVPPAGLRRVIARHLPPGLVAQTDIVRYDGHQLPVWHEASGNYLRLSRFRRRWRRRWA